MRRHSTIKLTLAVVALLLLMNTAVMYFIFGVNVFNPGSSAKGPDSSGNIAANTGSGYNPRWKASGDAGMDGEESGGAGVDGGSAPSESLDVDSTNIDNSDGDSTSTGETETGSDPTGAGVQQNVEDEYLTAMQVKGVEGIDLFDKLAAAAIMTKISREDGEAIYDMAQDGVTYEELDRIETILKKYLSEAEIEKLKSILEKSVSG